MKFSNSRKRLFTRQFWKTIETKYYILFLLAVFFSFCSLGFVSDLLNNFQYSYFQLFTSVLIVGSLSAGYAYAATKKLSLIFLFISLQVIYVLFLRPKEFPSYSPDQLEMKYRVVGISILVCITIGYAFFVTFITKVGINHFLMKAEMDLAKEIHEVLVPEINYSFDKVNISGKSIPTAEVGGDLVDVIESDNAIYCAVADVSGHGVSSGVYTGMFKSSLRTILSSNNKLAEIITQINNSLFPLTKKNMFITASMLKIDKQNNAEFIVAGHLPLLHFCKKDNKVNEHITKQIPIGVKEGFDYKSSSIEFDEGDIFIMITDGITETADKNNHEFGIERVKQTIIDNSTESTKEISNKLFAKLDKYGQQKDDITLLVVKC